MRFFPMQLKVSFSDVYLTADQFDQSYVPALKRVLAAYNKQLAISSCLPDITRFWQVAEISPEDFSILL
jgi:hypothetical protein